MKKIPTVYSTSFWLINWIKVLHIPFLLIIYIWLDNIQLEGTVSVTIGTLVVTTTDDGDNIVVILCTMYKNIIHCEYAW